MFAEVSDICWRCFGTRNTFSHSWYYCPLIRWFWQEVLDCIKAIVNNIPLNPQIVLLGCLQNTVRNDHIEMVHNILMAMKVTVVKNGKLQPLPLPEYTAQTCLDCHNDDQKLHINLRGWVDHNARSHSVIIGLRLSLTAWSLCQQILHSKMFSF